MKNVITWMSYIDYLLSYWRASHHESLQRGLHHLFERHNKVQN